MRTWLVASLVAIVGLLAAGCRDAPSPGSAAPPPPVVDSRSVADSSTPRAKRLAEAAMGQVGRTVGYDASYVVIPYPGGDVPTETGVCTDVVVRAFRELGVDLQVEVHEDMAEAWDEYPRKWALTKPDSNIDHRRVPNLQVYFERAGMSEPVTQVGADYLPGDVVTWDVFGRPHIGIVSTRVARDGTRWCVAHNIGRGAEVEDMLFLFKITGHYRPF